MPDPDNRLYLFEALELRTLFDRRIQLLEKLLRPEGDRRPAWAMAERDGTDLRPAPGFELSAVEEELKRLRARRLRLNEAIQIANFGAQIPVAGERVSLARALELRKALLEELERLTARTLESAYIRVLHKEERDIEKPPPRPYPNTREAHDQALEQLRQLVTALHQANHSVTVNYRDP
jgi:DNA repair exonuclease SbcCD ATPase subunit